MHTLDRRSIKQRAKGQVKRHYMLLVVLCAISVFLGTEFNQLVSNAQTWYDILTGRETVVELEGLRDRKTARDLILDDLRAEDVAAGREEADRQLKRLQEGTAADAMLGRRKGVLAAAVNAIGSGQLYATLGAALNSVFHSGNFAATLLILGGTAFYAAVWIFLRNLYKAVLRRAFLETRSFRKFPLGHLLHVHHARRWARTALSLLLADIYETLWWLTIVGGAIKRYSYFLVPFIVAENPDIRPGEAVKLSRRMMDGHKWECFKLEFSYLGWMVLGFFTFGATEALWSLPYRMAAFTEYYAALRQEAKAKGVEGATRLNDDWLYEPAARDLLERTYEDILRRQDLVDVDIVELSPVKRFFARNFGLWLATLDEKRVYSRQEGLRHQLAVGRMELEGEAYPSRLNPLWNRERAALTGRVSYLSPCTVWSLVVVFFAFCMVGWLWEVTLHLVQHGQFANRGAMHGPWLPIYGSGVVMICVLLYRLRRRPALEAAAIVVLCGFVEYMTSYILELARGMRWWDYTGYFLNLNGRICAEGLAVFALGGMAAVYFLVPLIDAAVIRVRPRLLVSVCVALLVCFAGDLVYSQFVPNVGAGITDDLEEEIPALPGSTET